MNLRPLAPHASALAKLRYTQICELDGGEPFELELGFAELADADARAFRDDFFQGVASMDFSSGDVYGNGCGEKRAAANAFDGEVGEDPVFLFRDVLEADEVVFGDVLHKLPYLGKAH